MSKELTRMDQKRTIGNILDVPKMDSLAVMLMVRPSFTLLVERKEGELQKLRKCKKCDILTPREELTFRGVDSCYCPLCAPLIRDRVYRK